MASVSFGYEPWDDQKDLLLKDPGNSTAFDVMNAGVKIGQRTTLQSAESENQSGRVLDGMLGMVAGALEWLRWYGYSIAEVESRVRVAKANSLGRNDQQLRKAQLPVIARSATASREAARLSADTKRLVQLD